MKSEVQIEGSRLRIARYFDAPREEVFSWWTEASRLSQWSGCREAEKCEVEMDFRVGGGFTQTMHLAGKGAFTIVGTYDEIAAPERIAYRVNLGMAVTRVTLDFLVEGRGTKLVLTQDGFPGEAFSKTVSQGSQESFDRLEGVLAERLESENA